MPAGEAAGWLLAMRAAYLSGRVQTVCNRFAGLRAHYGIEWWMLDTGTRLVPDPGSTLFNQTRPAQAKPPGKRIGYTVTDPGRAQTKRYATVAHGLLSFNAMASVLRILDISKINVVKHF
jgi:hypothetical protein